MRTLLLDSGAALSLSSVVAVIGPIIGAVLAAAVSGVLGIAGAVLNVYLKRLGFTFTSDQYATVQRSAEKIVKSWWAGEQAAIADVKFNVGNPIVQKLAQFVLDDLGLIATHLNLTSDNAATFVLARIGDLQTELLKALGAPQGAQSAIGGTKTANPQPVPSK